MMDGNELKKWRLKHGFTQMDIARATGMHPVTVSKIERGILRTKLSWKQHLDLSRSRGMYADRMLRDADNPPRGGEKK